MILIFEIGTKFKQIFINRKFKLFLLNYYTYFNIYEK